jgi:hypothetical protein
MTASRLLRVEPQIMDNAQHNIGIKSHIHPGEL